MKKKKGAKARKARKGSEASGEPTRWHPAWLPRPRPIQSGQRPRPFARKGRLVARSTRAERDQVRSPTDDKAGPPLHQPPALVEEIGAAIGPLGLAAVGWAKAASATSRGVPVASAHQSRKLLRKPCGRSGIPRRSIIRDIVASLITPLRTLGNRKPSRPKPARLRDHRLRLLRQRNAVRDARLHALGRDDPGRRPRSRRAGRSGPRPSAPQSGSAAATPGDRWCRRSSEA